MTGQHITAALFIDCGQTRRDGTYVQPPRARYECLLCGTHKGPVAGPIKVAAFVTAIRTDHRATCPATTQGAAA